MYKVGDIIRSIAPQDNKWRLCQGGKLSDTAYSDFMKLTNDRYGYSGQKTRAYSTNTSYAGVNMLYDVTSVNSDGTILVYSTFGLVNDASIAMTSIIVKRNENIETLINATFSFTTDYYLETRNLNPFTILVGNTLYVGAFYWHGGTEYVIMLGELSNLSTTVIYPTTTKNNVSTTLTASYTASDKISTASTSGFKIQYSGVDNSNNPYVIISGPKSSSMTLIKMTFNPSTKTWTTSTILSVNSNNSEKYGYFLRFDDKCYFLWGQIIYEYVLSSQTLNTYANVSTLSEADNEYKLYSFLLTYNSYIPKQFIRLSENEILYPKIYDLIQPNTSFKSLKKKKWRTICRCVMDDRCA